MTVGNLADACALIVFLATPDPDRTMPQAASLMRTAEIRVSPIIIWEITRKAALGKLIATADALVNNLRGDLPAKMGLDYKTLSAANPKLVCVHVSAYGRDNERASWPGYDYLMQAESGLMHLTGEPDRPPVRSGTSLIDMGTGMWAAIAVMAALTERGATGAGKRVVTSLYETALMWMTYHLASYWASVKCVSVIALAQRTAIALSIAASRSGSSSSRVTWSFPR